MRVSEGSGSGCSSYEIVRTRTCRGRTIDVLHHEAETIGGLKGVDELREERVASALQHVRFGERVRHFVLLQRQTHRHSCCTGALTSFADTSERSRLKRKRRGGTVYEFKRTPASVSKFGGAECSEAFRAAGCDKA